VEDHNNTYKQYKVEIIMWPFTKKEEILADPHQRVLPMSFDQFIQSGLAKQPNAQYSYREINRIESMRDRSSHKALSQLSSEVRNAEEEGFPHHPPHAVALNAQLREQTIKLGRYTIPFTRRFYWTATLFKGGQWFSSGINR